MAVIDPVLSQEYIDSWGVNPYRRREQHTASGNKGRGVKIAVIDTGIDYTHIDLQDNYRGEVMTLSLMTMIPMMTTG